MAAHKYKGILGRRDQVGFPREGKNVEDWLLPRVAALFADCGVAMGADKGWAGVALILAQRHVPGFEFKSGKPLGAPKKTTLDDDISVLREMTKRIADGQTKSQAAHHLAKTRRKGESKEAIERRYRRILDKAGQGLSMLRREGRQKSP